MQLVVRQHANGLIVELHNEKGVKLIRKIAQNPKSAVSLVGALIRSYDITAINYPETWAS